MYDTICNPKPTLLLISSTLLMTGLLQAQSPFIDQVPNTTAGGSETVEERRLQLSPGVRVVMRSKLGVVVRGELLSLTKDAAMVVTDRTRLRNPTGVEYKFSSIQSLNIPEHELHWAKGENAEDFLKEVSESETIIFENLLEFQASAPKPEGEPDDSTEMQPDSTIITMQPAKNQPIVRPTVKVICGNCMKEVSLSSDSGQECPHCKILWDSSPLDAAQLEELKKAEAKADAQIAGLNRANSASFQEFVNTGEMGNSEIADAGNAQGFPNNNVQNNVVQNNGNIVPQPVNVPPPMPVNAQPQEITLENLPLWMKVSVFAICMGILYYAVFVR